MIKILVTGGTGQLASCIAEASLNHIRNMKFVYRSSAELDITNLKAVSKEFETGNYDFCINCAAYTNVDAAETNPSFADAVNRMGARNLANISSEKNTILIHISTDFVFDGSNSLPYSEEDEPYGLGVYGNTKLLGEKEIASACKKHFIIRTSWLYSEYGHNFMKSMLKYGKEMDKLSIVYDQIGTPTYAKDLADVILLLIEKNIKSYGTYHYSNEGVASWYDFAKAIFEINKITVSVNPIRTDEYPSPAKRPSYSVLDKTKIKDLLGIQIPYWRNSLLRASEVYQKNNLVT
ncbi:dTDP-4-dehydrorhamnose reductase [uncultured Croceitalea sp.]|uniref:dTDP-4-dehydrorhamnose reductase n=1 Tax=uncultured Croceitalea sp. TaxID=1798908 RepID=UPI0033068581